MVFLEVCCFNPSSAVIASEAGADRIELCDSQHAGGTTPPAEWVTQVKSRVTIPVFVMIRPRGGDFYFTDAEFERMKTDMDELKPYADGFVVGILDAHRNIDVSRTSELVQRAAPLPCTFHRACDETADPVQALEDVIATGCHSVLTSGGAPCAGDGLNVLEAMVRGAQGRIAIMPGGGVRSSNIARIQGATGAEQFHSTAILHQQGSLADAEEVRSMKSLLRRHAADGDRTRTSQHLHPRHSTTDATNLLNAHFNVSAVSVGATPADAQRQVDFDVSWFHHARLHRTRP